MLLPVDVVVVLAEAVTTPVTELLDAELDDEELAVEELEQLDETVPLVHGTVVEPAFGRPEVDCTAAAVVLV